MVSELRVENTRILLPFSQVHDVIIGEPRAILNEMGVVSLQLEMNIFAILHRASACLSSTSFPALI